MKMVIGDCLSNQKMKMDPLTKQTSKRNQSEKLIFAIFMEIEQKNNCGFTGELGSLVTISAKLGGK